MGRAGPDWPRPDRRAARQDQLGTQHHAHAPAPPDGKGRRPHTEVRDGMHVYFPAVSREDAAARQTRDLLGRVYHGSLSLLVSAMTREEALSKAEIDELYAILDEMEAKQGDA